MRNDCYSTEQPPDEELQEKTINEKRCLELVGSKSFRSGVVELHYKIHK